jgi:hypothetical protein
MSEQLIPVIGLMIGATIGWCGAVLEKPIPTICGGAIGLMALGMMTLDIVERWV